MKRTLSLLLLLSVLLGACQSAPPPTREVIVTVLATSAAGTTPSPAPVEPTATLQPSRTPTLTPTRTPLPTPTPPGMYSHARAGFALILSPAWVNEYEDDTSAIFYNEADQLSLFGSLNMEEVRTAIEDVAAPFADELEDSQQSFDQLELDNGLLAERASLSGRDFQGNLRGVQLLFVQDGGRRYVFAVVGPNSVMNTRRFTIEKMFKGIQFRRGDVFGQPRAGTLVLLGYEPEEADLDPAQFSGSAAGIAGYLYRGLVKLTPQMQLVPDLAESWVVDAGGQVYTFTLRNGGTFQSGEPLTAEDVRFSWERATDEDAESTTALTYLGDIEGVKNKLDGEAETIHGLDVLDERTLVVRLDQPKPYFLYKLTYPTAFVVSQTAVQKKPANWWEEPDASGPYGLEEILPGEALVFTRNPAYHSPAEIEHIVHLTYWPGSGLSYFRTGEIDQAYLSGLEARNILTTDEELAPEVLAGPSMCTTLLMFRNTAPPLDDPLVREAFARAIDRARLVEYANRDMELVAESLLPPGMPGFRSGQLEDSYDPAAARAALERSIYAGDLLTVTLTTSGSGLQSSGFQDVLVDMWREALGVEVAVESVPENFVETARDSGGQIVSFGWCADYPDPQNFLDILFHSESDFNVAGFGDPEIDAGLEAARVEQDPAARLAIYQALEARLLEDYAALPLMHSVDYQLVSPRLAGYIAAPIGVPIVEYLSLLAEESPNGG